MDVNMDLITMLMSSSQPSNHHNQQQHIPPPPATTTQFTPQFDAPTYTQITEFEKQNSMSAMREMIFRIAAMQPIQIDPETIKPPKRKNVKISKDPQSVAARHRREKISEKIRILQRLVPGGTKMDTASMLDEAIHYVKFLKKQVQRLERGGGGGGIETELAGCPPVLRMMESNNQMMMMMMGLGSMQQMMC